FTFDRRGGDVLASTDDRVLDPAGDRQVTGMVDTPEVPGTQPAALDRGGCVRAEVPEHDRRAADQDLAVPADRDRLVCAGCDDPQLLSGEGGPDRTVAGVVDGVHGRRTGRLGHAVGQDHRYAECL